MNLKAVYYAISRMLLPTLTVVVLAFMWTLSATETFGFLISKSTWASILRIILLLAELFWFMYLYESYMDKETLKEAVENDDKFYRIGDGSLNDLRQHIKSKYSIQYDSSELKVQAKEVNNYIIIKKV